MKKIKYSLISSLIAIKLISLNKKRMSASANENSNIIKSNSKNYAIIKIAGQGAFSMVFVVEEEKSKEK